jgi:alpha-N-arabinofuranosidase
MYVPFQDATSVPISFDASTYRHGDITLPRVDAIAAKDAAGRLWLAFTNLDPNQPADAEVSLTGVSGKSATGETLTAPQVDSANTFVSPAAVVPRAVSVNIQNGRLVLTLAPKSVTVVSVEQ